MSSVDLSRYDNKWYSPGAGRLKRMLWYAINAALFDSWWCPSSVLKSRLLRIFGAKVGLGVVIKPRVNIKYPWLLSIGDHVWIGEGAWLDNLASLSIGNNVCVSQGAYLLTGNHDYRDPYFGLIVRPITLCDGTWVGARAIVCPGVTMHDGSIVTSGSVLQVSAEASGIYRGNPAQRIRERVIQ